MLVGAVAGFQRFYYGLGATTHLSDRFPWGFWIGFDFLGIGLAAAGFTIAATVHLLHMERYEPLVRPAILTAFIGYLMVVLILVVDLGRPLRFWHPVVMWNPHSVMFEITWCVLLYSTVLALEFAPVVLEKFRLAAPIKALRAISIPVVIAGVILSTLHQSSFGSLYLIAPGRLHPLWYSPILPILFFISCVAAGLSMIVFESFLLSRSAPRALSIGLLADIGKAVVVVLAVYGTVRVQDLINRNALGHAFTFSSQGLLFLGEFILGVVAPAVMLLFRRVRESRDGLFFASVLVLMGFMANRMNTVVTGMERWPDFIYIPTWQELFIGLGIATFGFVAFGVVAKHFNVLEHEQHT
jgi:Ni/Fe-hydrogenase subunit HybB-like protein